MIVILFPQYKAEEEENRTLIAIIDDTSKSHVTLTISPLLPFPINRTKRLSVRNLSIDSQREKRKKNEIRKLNNNKNEGTSRLEELCQRRISSRVGLHSVHADVKHERFVSEMLNTTRCLFIGAYGSIFDR